MIIKKYYKNCLIYDIIYKIVLIDIIVNFLYIFCDFRLIPLFEIFVLEFFFI